MPLAMALRRISSAPKAIAPRSGFINENQTTRGLFVNIFQKRLKNKKFGADKQMSKVGILFLFFREMGLVLRRSRSRVRTGVMGRRDVSLS